MRRSLPRNAVVLSWVSLFQDAASEMLYPIMPLFVTSVLGAPVAAVGLIEGIAEGTASFAKIASGRLADIHRRKPMIAAGYAVSSVAKLLMGLAGTWPAVLVLRFADRVGKGLRTSPRDALLADETVTSNRGSTFGFHRAMDTAGAVLGPLLGLAFYELFGHRLRLLFVVAFIPAIVSVALIRLVDEPGVPRVERVRNVSGPDAPRSIDAPRLGLPSAYRRALTVLGLFSLVNFSDALVLLRAKELGLGVTGVVAAYCLYNAVYAALAYPAGIISDRLPRRLVIAVGLAVFTISYAGLGIVDSSGWVWVLLPLYGGYTALTDGVARAWIADLLPPDRRGTGIGLYHGVIGVGAIVSAGWAGLAWGDGGEVPLIIAGAATGIVAAMLTLGGRFFDR